MEKGYILYQGPSRLDGAQIVAIATMASSNAKTGNIPQIWILREDTHPVEASKLGLDSSICGNCKHRRFLGGACYVNLGNAPTSVWKAYKRGNYSPNVEDFFSRIAGKTIRVGAYGEPSALPLELISRIHAAAKNMLGYTHQWNGVGADLVGMVQASVDNETEQNEAIEKGWKVFRVIRSGETAGVRECLADAKGLQCSACKVCTGSKLSVFITVHGSLKNRFQG